MNGKEYLFVDGYNIINDWGNLKNLARENLENARNKLINVMSEYHSFTGIDVIIVFDAHMVKKGNRKIEGNKDLKVVFTKENETADSYIERALESINKRSKVRVATSDGSIQQIVFGKGGNRISSREMLLELRDIKKRIDLKQKEVNKINNIVVGRMDDDNLKKLENFKKKL